MKINGPEYSFVILPYLKTNNTVKIGKCEFKSTENTDGLTEKQKTELHASLRYATAKKLVTLNERPAPTKCHAGHPRPALDKVYA